MAERTIFTLAAHVARQLTKARVQNEKYRCGDTDFEGWLLWSYQWKVEHCRPGKHSISDPYKISTTMMVVLGTDGTLYRLQPEKKWDNGIIHYPETRRIREAAWLWLGSDKEPLTTVADIDFIWRWLQSRPPLVETHRQPNVTKFYPPKIAPYKSGEDMMRKLLYRRLNRVDRDAKQGASTSPRAATGAAMAPGSPQVDQPSAAAPLPEPPSLLARVVDSLRRR